MRSRLQVWQAAGLDDDEGVRLEHGVRECARRLSKLGVTGAMILTDLYVAVLIEGLAAHVEGASEDCMPSFLSDATKIMIDEVIDQRRFKTWSLVYAGRIEYVSRKIDALLEESVAPDERDRRVSEVVQMMKSFAEI